MLDEFIEKIPLSAAEVNKKTKKTGIYFINRPQCLMRGKPEQREEEQLET